MNQPELTTMDKALVMMAASRGVPIESMAYSSPVPDWKIDTEPTWNWKDMHYRVAHQTPPEARK